MRAVAAIPAFGLLAGSALGLQFPDSLLPATAALVLTAAAAAWAWRTQRPAVLAGAVCTAFAAGAMLLSAHAWRQAWRPTLRLAFEERARAQRLETTRRAEPAEDATVFATLTGTLRADAARRPTGVSLSLDVTSIDDRPVGGGVSLTVAGSLAVERAGAWRAGRVVRAPAGLRRPSRYLNPGVPDEERALARRGTTLVGSVKSGALVEVVRPGSLLSEAAWRGRAFARRAIGAAVGRWSARSAAIVSAIVIGDRAGLDDAVERRLQEAGTYHVIAISGGNIAILAGLTLTAFRLGGMLGPAAMLTAIAGLLGYAYLVGGGASVTRATLMAVVYFAGRAIDLRGPPTNALAVVAGALVAANPLAIADPGFLLTCGATAAILVVVPVVRPSAHGRLAAAASLFIASLAAEAVLMPISAFWFSRVTFAGLALNFAAIPLMAVAQIAGMAAVAVHPVSPTLASAAGWVAHLGADGLVRSAGFVEWMPVLTWRVAPPHWLTLASYYTALGTSWVLWRGGCPAVRRVAVVTTLAAAGWMLFEPARFLRRADHQLRVTFIDVGQGDAALVRFPRGATMLVDAGGANSGSFDIGDRVVGAVMRHAGLRRLDTAVVTHGDADHLGGLPSVVRDFRPREVWEGIPVVRSRPLAALRAGATAHGARWTTLQADDRFSIDGVDLIVHHPGLPDWERQDVRNDDSIVLELRWRDVSIVLTGDIGRDTERAIADRFAPAGIRVIKVPHHGSLTSSSAAFLDRLLPRVAVFSVGRGNTFGHPAPDVLQRYRSIGAQILRTDRDGAVLLDTDGYSVQFATANGRQLRVR